MLDWSVHAAKKYLPAPDPHRRIGLALSGRGLRSVLFHLGGLRRLNELGLLARASAISAVSAGSIAAAALARGWPSLQTNAEGVFANFADVEERLWSFLGSFARRPRWRWTPAALLRRSLESRPWRVRLSPTHFERRLSGKLLLRNLPARPRFVFSATHLGMGERWELARDGIGGAELGRTSAGPVRLAQVVAAACAEGVEVPAVLLSLDPNGFDDRRTPYADPLRARAALLDGTALDPLALEPLWRSHRVVVSLDGGEEPLAPATWKDVPLRNVARAAAAARRSARAHQKRWLVSLYLANALEGAHASLAAYHGNYGLAGSAGYPEEVVAALAKLPADFTPPGETIAMTLVNHGYTLADAALRRHLPGGVLAEVPLLLPFPGCIDRDTILEASGPGKRAA